MNTATCPNCHHHRQGAYCSACGQNDRDYRRSLPPMVMELLREAFELDGRIVRSLKLLFFQPGALSAAFSANQRAHFVSPVRLYIFASLVFFFVFAQTAEIAAPNGQAVQIDPDKPLNDEQLESFRETLEPRAAAALDAIMAREEGLGKAALTALMEAVTSAAPDDQPSATGRHMISQLVLALDDPAETFDRLVDNAPLAMFFLLPVYALLLKLLYWRSGKYYVEHLVFALHLHAFAFLVFSVIALLPEQPAWVDALIDVLQIGFFVYYFLALRRFYEQSGTRTFFKFGALCIAYSILSIPAILLIMAVTVSLL